MVTKTEWAYHGTSTDILPLIRERGLIPRGSGVRFPEMDNPNETLLFFGDEEWVARDYMDYEGHGALVRFPMPDDAEVWLEYKDSEGQHIGGEYVTRQSVQPSSIEVKTPDGIWIPISELSLLKTREEQRKFALRRRSPAVHVRGHRRIVR